MKIFLKNLTASLLFLSALFFPKLALAADVNIYATVPATTATLSGFAPAGSVVFFKETGLIVGSTVTNSSGVFSKVISSTSGVHTYSIYLIDNAGRSTPETTLSPITLSPHMNTSVSNIHLAPTIAVSKTKIVQGEIVSVFGQASPGAIVNVFVNNIKRFSLTTGADSKWQIDLNGVNIADHSEFYAVSTRTGLPDSAKSFTVTLDVLACSEQNCNRTSTPPTTNPPATATPSAGTTTTENNQKIVYEIGQNLARTILYSSIFLISLVAIIVIFLIFLLSRRKKKKADLLADLENKVDQDLYQPNPQQLIHSDFEQTRQSFD